MILKILSIIFLLCISHSQAICQSFTGKCVGVIDGDTIVVLKEGKAVVIRIEAIDCPERHQDFFVKAKKFTSKSVFNKIVFVRFKEYDRYGRIVGRVKVNGKDLSLELVRAGLAWHYKKYSTDQMLELAEKQAREKKIGIWSMPNPVPPWEFRYNRKIKR